MVLNASLVAQTIKNPPEMRETWFPSLGWEDPLEEGMATHSCILAWKILRNREAWQPTIHGVPKSRIWLSTEQHMVLNRETFQTGQWSGIAEGLPGNQNFRLSFPFFLYSFIFLGLDIFAWEILWTEEPGRLQSLGLQKLSTEQQTTTDYIEQ